MTTWKHTILAVAVIVSMQAFPVAAQDAAKADPARIAAAKELLNAMGGVDQARASVQQFVDALIADIAQRDAKLAKPAEYFLRSETAPEKSRVKDYLADIETTASEFYASRFTAEEMKAIVAFQTSEAGRKFQKLTPELLGTLVPRMTKFQEALIRDMQKGTTAGASTEEKAPEAPAAEKK